MLEPLIWMFKTEGFKKHFLKISSFGLICYFIAAIVALLSMHIHNMDFFMNLGISIVNIILILLPALFITGYFWCLTDSIINRDDDVKASSIYNGRVGVVNKIELPELNTKKFLWRGIASIFATILLYIPIMLLLSLKFVDMSNVADFWGWDSSYIYYFGGGLAIFVSIFIPGMLWNYARRDSVVAVWNIPKVVYIMGNYTLKYILNTFLFFVFSVLYSFIVQFLVTILGLTFTKTIAENGATLYSFQGNDILLPLVIFFLINYLLGIYFVYVYSYLLGTIAPTSEY